MDNFSSDPRFTDNQIEDGKIIAIIAYITIVGLLIAIILNNDKKNPFAAYHIRQGLGIGLSGLVLGMIVIIPFLGWLVFVVGSFLLLIMWIMGVINALSGKYKPVPVLGRKYEEWFKGI